MTDSNDKPELLIKYIRLRMSDIFRKILDIILGLDMFSVSSSRRC